jgi:cytoskeletal protein RodZ
LGGNIVKKRMTRLLLLVCVFCIMLTGCGVNVDTHENELQPPVSASSDSGEETSSQTTASEPATTVPDTQKPAESTQPPEQTTEPPVTETQDTTYHRTHPAENSTFSVLSLTLDR